MGMASNDLQSLREELMEKERELSGMHQLLVDQDDDLRACQHRLGDLESTLLLACGDALHAAGGPTSSPLHPARRTLYDKATAVCEEDVDAAIESTTAFASVSTGESTLTPQRTEDRYSASAPLSLPPSPPPPTMLPRPHDESTQRRAATESPPRRIGTLSDTSESSQPRRDPQLEWVAEFTGSPLLSAPIEVGGTAGKVSTERPKDVDVAPRPRTIPVVSPSLLPSRSSAVPLSAVPGGGAAETFAPSRPVRTSDSPSSYGERVENPLECQREAQSTLPERPVAGRAGASGGGREGSMLGLDSYGRCLDRSFEARQEQSASSRRSQGGAGVAGVETESSDGSRSARPRDDQNFMKDYVERLARAERRAETAEAAERATAARMLSVARETTVAKGEAERLRVEVLELSRWREAVLDLRDVLNIAQERDRERGNEADREEGMSDDDPVARHAKWVSSSALETLLPRLHQSARDLLSDLASARARIETSPEAATAEDPATSNVVIEAAQRCGRYDRAAESGKREHAEESSCSDGRNETRESTLQGGRELGGERIGVTWTDSDGDTSEKSNESRQVDGLAVSPATAAVMSGVTGLSADEDRLASLRKSRETLRIMVDALREKDEENQKRILAFEQQVLDSSLAAVRQEALVSALRRQLESRDLGATTARESQAASSPISPEQGNDLAPRRRQSGKLSRLRHEVSLSAAQASPPVSTPRQSLCTNHAYRTGSPGAAGCDRCGGSSPAAATPTAESNFRGRLDDEQKARTPTTDILRRLLYENTPLSSSPRTLEPDGKIGVCQGDFGSAGERSRHGRRLFAEGSTVLRACPTAVFDVAEIRRGPGALFSDSACGAGAGGCQVGDYRRMVAEDDKCPREGKMSRVGGSQKPTTEKADAFNGRPGESEVPLAAGEAALRERLLRARRDFSALHTGHQTDGTA